MINIFYPWINDWFLEQKKDFVFTNIKQSWHILIMYLLFAYVFGIYANLIIKAIQSDNTLTIFAGISFLWIQSFVDAFIILTLYVMLKGKVSLRYFLIAFAIATIINNKTLLFMFYNFLIDNGLYPNFFKDDDPNVDGAALQYARVLLGLIILFYSLLCLIFMKRNLVKVFFAFFITGFFLAMTAFHALVIIYPKKESTQIILEEMKGVLKNEVNTMEICYKMEFHCIYVKNGDLFDGAKIDEKSINPLKHNEHLSIQLKAFNNVVNDVITKIRKSDEREIYYSDDKIPTQVFRSVLFGMKKINNDDIIVITDSKNAGITADFYLNWMAFNTLIAFMIWVSITLWAYDKHYYRNKNSQLNKIIN